MRKLLATVFAAAALSMTFAGTVMAETDDVALAQAYYNVLQSNQHVIDESEYSCFHDVWIADFDHDGTLEMAAAFFQNRNGDFILIADYTDEGTVLTYWTTDDVSFHYATYLTVQPGTNGFAISDGIEDYSNGYKTINSVGEMYSYSGETGMLTKVEESYWEIGSTDLFSSDSSVTNAITALRDAVYLEPYDYKDVEENVSLLSQASPEIELKYDSETKEMYFDNPDIDTGRTYVRPALPWVDAEFEALEE